ncbi:hypothetical protein ACX3OY_23490 [Citrobacter farmeri]
MKMALAFALVMVLIGCDPTETPENLVTDWCQISALRQQWHLFAIPADKLLGSFFDAINAFECPFGNSGLPRHMHDSWFQTRLA